MCLMFQLTDADDQYKYGVAFSGSGALLLVLLGFAVGAFGTLVGAGGGFILAPRVGDGA